MFCGQQGHGVRDCPVRDNRPARRGRVAFVLPRDQNQEDADEEGQPNRVPWGNQPFPLLSVLSPITTSIDPSKTPSTFPLRAPRVHDVVPGFLVPVTLTHPDTACLIPTHVLIDSGASSSFMDESFARANIIPRTHCKLMVVPLVQIYLDKIQ